MTKGSTTLDSSGTRDLRDLVRSYMRALLIVALVLSLGQLFIQRELSHQESLLQRLESVQDQLALSYRVNSSDLEKRRFQIGLSDLARGLSEDSEAQGLLQRAQAQLQAVIGTPGQDRSIEAGEKELLVWELQRHTLDVLVIHLNQDGQQRLRLLRYVECMIVCLIFGVLGMEAVLIFRPAATQVQDLFLEVESSRQLLGRRLKLLNDSHESMKADLKAAADVQRSLLPREMPDIAGWEFAWSFKASHDVAGDMFNLIRLDETHVAVYVLDVSGHGVPAALLSVSLSRAITANLGSLLKRRLPEAPFYQLVRPSEVAQELNRRFPVMSESDQFFTLLYGILDTVDHTFEFVQAGHPGPVHLSENEIQVWEMAPDPPIGILPDIEFCETVIQVKPGDLVFLYTDGVIEAQDRRHQMFGLERLTECLRQNRPSGIESGVETLYDEMRNFTQGLPQKDDITMLGFGLSPTAGPAVQLGTAQVTKSGRYRSFHARSDDD